MKIYKLPKVIRALVFDIDLTLYDNRDYDEAQKDLLVHRLSEYLRRPFEEIAKEVAEIKDEFKRLNQGKELSLGNTFLQFGISIDESVNWRRELFKPEEFFEPDLNLIQTMEKLQKRYKLNAVTNNPTIIGRKTLQALGIEAYFPHVIGLDVSGESKPTMKPFFMLSEKLQISLNEMVSIGDRFAVDLELPLANGLGGILVEKISDVYDLPTILH
ncbi:MAG: HAD family hydrolase [Deferribacteres bacterium]|nr:HAD family hydrolase [candidate division KSB1 bacterium]MCB9503632.1 HAD family hydrolase [Deferribacteres bacterium]